MSHKDSDERSVVITGLGILSPIGIGVSPFWENLNAGRSGIRPLAHMEYSAAPHNAGGEVTEFDDKSAKKEYLKSQRKSIKVMCREIQMGVASASLAIEHSGIDVTAIDHERIGVDFGANLMLSPPDVLRDACWTCTDPDDASHQFHYERWGQTGLPSMEPLWLLRYLPNMPACHIGIAADARGPNNSITLDEASGNLALGEAFRIIARGHADIMIAGTTGTRLHPVKTIHAALWDKLAEGPGDDPAHWSRPFDANRDGQVPAEGACSFILEEEAHAKARGARIYGKVLGAGSSCVANPAGKPDIRKALANAMTGALNDAGLKPTDIGHINAHGLGTRECDVDESRAIHDIFGDYAGKVPVTALKSVLGNSGSACGTLELAASVLALQQGLVPQTLNYETPDAQCRLNVVHGNPATVENRTFLKLSVTRLGQASAVIASA